MNPREHWARGSPCLAGGRSSRKSTALPSSTDCARSSVPASAAEADGTSAVAIPRTKRTMRIPRGDMSVRRIGPLSCVHGSMRFRNRDRPNARLARGFTTNRQPSKFWRIDTFPAPNPSREARIMRIVRALVLLLSFVLATPAFAADLPTAKPGEVGLSSERLERLGQTLRADVEKGRIPGAVVLIARRGRVAFVEAAGFRDPVARTPMTPDAIFRIASMTKPMVTVAALSLYEEGRLFPADPVSKYIPAFKGQTVGLERAAAVREMTIQDLMRHTSGLTYGNRGKSEIYKMYPQSSNESSLTLTMDEFIDRLAKAPLLYQPGTQWEYSLSTDVLGRVVEVVTGKPLGEVL